MSGHTNPVRSFVSYNVDTVQKIKPNYTVFLVLASGTFKKKKRKQQSCGGVYVQQKQNIAFIMENEVL